MKYVIVGSSIAAAIGIGVWLRHAPAPTQPNTMNELPATLAGPTTPPPAAAASTTSPLPKNTIITKNGMHIETTKEGTGAVITNGQTATVDYVGKLSDGSVFDASRNHGTTGFSFSLGAGQVIKGWDQGVLGMKVGETRILTIPPELGYGPMGYPPVIPANATLIFEVTLLAIQ